MDGGDDNILPADQLSAIENSQASGNSLLETMEAVENLEGNTQDITIIEGAMPFFLESENHTHGHVAEEIEIETSSVAGCTNSANHHHGYIKYACEITLTLPPLTTPSQESTEATSELVEENSHQQPVQIILSEEDVEEKNSYVFASADDGAIANDENENVNLREPENVIILSEFSTENPMEKDDQLDCESTGSLHDDNSVSSLAAEQAVDDSNISPRGRKPACANEVPTTDVNEDEGEEKHSNSNNDLHHSSIDKGMMNLDCSSNSGNNDDSSSESCLNKDKQLDKDDEEELGEGAVAAVRVSCIRWARKCAENGATEGIDHPVLRSALQSTNLLQNDNLLLASLPSIRDKMDEEAEEDGEDLHYSDIWIPEITTTIEEESVQIPEIPQRQLPLKCDPPSCFHPCCLMMKELWSCIPWWMNYGNSRTCCMPCPSVRPPGFEDPPETQWQSVNIHQADVSDGALRYKCQSCEGFVEYRSTKQKFHLNLARLKYPCKQCDRKFVTKKQLKLHSMRHSEKTKSCTYCEKRFLTKSELRNHLNTHTRERPHQCPVCFLRFAHSSRYYAHIRHFHKKYDCNECYSKKCCSFVNSISTNANSK